MNLSDETLMAYVDGELDAAMRAQVASAAASDPEIARRVARHQSVRKQLRAGFDPILAEPVPPHLVALARSAKNHSRDGNVLPFAGKPPVKRIWVQWASLAASFVLGALVWQFAARSNLSQPIIESQGALVASGVLAQALSGQLASQQAPSAAVQVGVSFRSRQGRFCRTFRLRDATGDAGLACHENDRWTVQVLAHSEARGEPAAEYRQAATSLPPAVLSAVTDSIAGDALDSSAEARARDSGWQEK
jgi:anti-sigma factor RsiW